jgi:hypothetical protein
VLPDPNADVVLTLTYWRPQRKPIGEGPNREACLDEIPPCTWIDMGGFRYQAHIFHGGPPDVYCRADTGGLIHDTAPDLAANRENTFTMTVNVTQCLATVGRSWQPGETLTFELIALAPGPAGGSASQSVAFHRASS